jgi:hypothetical protein
MIPASHTLKLWLAAIVGAGMAWGVKLLLIDAPRMWMAIATLVVFGIAYLLLTAIMGVDEAIQLTSRITRGRRRT